MNIFVAGIPERFTKKELGALFEEYGTVLSVKVIMDRGTGISRGFGFVEMPDEREARAAITSLHDKVIDDNNITVKEARARE